MGRNLPKKCNEHSRFIADTHSFRFLYRFLTYFFTATMPSSGLEGRWDTVTLPQAALVF
jgi:hypothetical protein